MIGLEFIPVTITVSVIAKLNVNLNQGSLNAYIFFCQIVTILFPSVGYPAWLVRIVSISTQAGIQPSLTTTVASVYALYFTTTVASVYTLCFTQLAAISLKILHPTRYHSKHHSKETLTVFFYDGTQQYFKRWHAVAGSFATLVLLFLIVSSLYLSIYPFQWFQKCFNKLKFKKDFFVSVTDVFTGPYKDCTQQNSRDYRYLQDYISL